MSDMPGRPLRKVRLGPREVLVERGACGEILLHSPHELGAYARKMTERLEHWANVAPGRIFIAQRGAAGGWETFAYAEVRRLARRVAQGLLDRGLSAERPVAVLSGNDIEHALIELGAMYAGIPYAPVSPAYSLLSTDFSKLKHVIGLLTPGLIYASGPQFRPALDACAPAGTELVTREEFIERLDTEPGPALDQAHARVGPDTIVKFLFTSGSTGLPKAVINTQRMWCANQAMIANQLAFLQDEPPVLVDWAPWHHTAAGNHDFGLVLNNGGSYYIDEGRPMPGAIEATVRNLREIAPTFYFNVPKGYEALLPYLKEDAKLRENFFRRLKVLWFAGAGLAQHVFDEMKELSYRVCGEEVLFLTGLGSTETAPFAIARTWPAGDAANMGLPPPGARLKLVPMQEKLEMRVKGPHITPGYWRQPELTAQAFDEEGWYRLGDAFTLADPGDPGQGLLFKGRIAEDFKLATGTWVHVGPLRTRFISHFAPYVRDVVIAGEGRNELGALVFPSMDFPEEKFRAMLESFPGTGSSNRIARAILLKEPPSLDAGEVTDKGTINQKAVLHNRRQLVDDLYGS